MKKLLPCTHGESGMLLLEVVLATMIFAIAAVSLAIALNATIDSFLDIRRESQIRVALQSALAETRGQNLAVGSEELAVTGTPGVAYHREVRTLTRQNEKNEPVNNLYEIVIDAKWQEKDQNMERQVQEYVYQAQ